MTSSPPVSGPCAYCKVAPAVHRDHVIPKSLQRKYDIPAHLAGTVPACFACNMLKATLRLVPLTWADRLDEINALVSGTPFRVWDGTPATRWVTA